MNKIIEKVNKEEALKKIEKIKNSIEEIINNLKNERSKPLELFYKLKFNKLYVDSIKDKNENFIEILNQYFTYLVSYKAVLWLINQKYGDFFDLSLGNIIGIDIIGKEKKIIAEVFASVNPNNNQKIQKEIERLSKKEYEEYTKFIFYHSPNEKIIDPEKINGINVIYIDKDQLFSN
jgi:hypothetical protein